MYTVTDYEEAKKGGLDIYYHGNDKNINSFNREFGDGDEVDDWYSQKSIVRVKRERGKKAMLIQALQQAEYLSKRFETDKVRIGAAMWAGIDHQRGYHPDPFLVDHLNVSRLPRYTYYLYQSQNHPNYKSKGIKTGPMIYIVNELTQLSPKDVVVFSNCDTLKLTWLGKDCGTQKPSKDSKYENLPHPPFVFKNIFSLSDVKSRGRNGKDEAPPKMILEGFVKGELVAKQEKIYAQRSKKIQLSVDGAGIDLVADGSDFTPVRATIIDQYGTKKVLAEENIYFEVTGPAKVIGGANNFANPVKSSFGIATALIRATNKPGTITVKAFVNGLEPDSLIFESKPVSFKTNYNKEYLETSKKVNKNNVVINQLKEEKISNDVKVLKEEVKRLRLELIGKNQDIMELGSNPQR